MPGSANVSEPRGSKRCGRAASRGKYLYLAVWFGSGSESAVGREECTAGRLGQRDVRNIVGGEVGPQLVGSKSGVTGYGKVTKVFDCSTEFFVGEVPAELPLSQYRNCLDIHKIRSSDVSTPAKRERRLREVLAFDHDFQAVGFLELRP